MTTKTQLIGWTADAYLEPVLHITPDWWKCMYSFYTKAPHFWINHHQQQQQVIIWGEDDHRKMIRPELIGISPPCKWDQTARRAHFSSRARLGERLAIGIAASEQTGRMQIGSLWESQLGVNLVLDGILNERGEQMASLGHFSWPKKGIRGVGMGTLTAFLTRILAHWRIPTGLTLTTIWHRFQAFLLQNINLLCGVPLFMLRQNLFWGTSCL